MPDLPSVPWRKNGALLYRERAVKAHRGTKGRVLQVKEQPHGLLEVGIVDVQFEVHKVGQITWREEPGRTKVFGVRLQQPLENWQAYGESVPDVGSCPKPCHPRV